MSASNHTQTSIGRPPLQRVDVRLRVAVAASVLLHSVAAAWMLGLDDPPVQVMEMHTVQAVILTAARTPPVPTAVETLNSPPVAVVDNTSPVAKPMPQRRIEPKEPPRHDAAKRLPKLPVPVLPETEATLTTAQTAVPPTVSAPRFEADYLSNPPPVYPRLSRRLREEGEVELRVRVDATGRAITVELARSSGSVRLDEAALHAVRNWRFEPARRGERAVEDWVRVPILFKLEA